MAWSLRGEKGAVGRGDEGRGMRLVTEVGGQGEAPLRLVFLCAGDPADFTAWSGTPYHMLEALRTEFDVVHVVRRPWSMWFTFARKFLRKFSRGTIDIYWSPAMARWGAAKTLKAVKQMPSDIIFTVAITPLCAELAHLGNVVFVSDATQATMVEYNPHHARLTRSLKRAADKLETHSIRTAMASLFPSEWAASSAIDDHGGSHDRVVKIPWGANLPADAITPPESRPTGEWRLLFVGRDWYGKGGAIALDAIAELRRRGHPVQLEIVGCAPPGIPPRIPGVTFHGFLDKNVEGERQALRELFQKAHLFFLPTRFDALGIVFAEAASYAIPAVSYRTGGVPAMVVDGVSGVLLEEGSPGSAFADAIADLMQDRERYVAMSYAALERSRKTLNWPSWAAEVRHVLERMVQTTRLSPKRCGSGTS